MSGHLTTKAVAKLAVISNVQVPGMWDVLTCKIGCDLQERSKHAQISAHVHVLDRVLCKAEAS